MKADVVVQINDELLDAMLEGARRLHPKETILLLRGRKTDHTLVVSDLVVPPLATHGHGFAGIRTYMLPMDFSIIGTFHSHPSGNTMPSSADLNHSLGRILIITGYPYEDENDIAVYNRSGERLVLHIAKS
jgi:proteasome lid subunit RPN8/RPN11